MSESNSAGDVVTKELVLKNKYGLHARPATLLAEAANRFEASVFVEKDGQRSNGKSIFELMMLAAESGSVLVVHAEGPDASDAVEALAALVESKFNEE